MHGIQVSSAATWCLLVDIPLGSAFDIELAETSQSVIATENPCPEYRLDLLDRQPAALVGILPIDELAATIKVVWQGKEFHPKVRTSLTQAERETLRLLAQENSNREIAELRGTCVGTVKNTLSTIYLKLGLKSRTQAVHYYYGRWHRLEDWYPPKHVEELGHMTSGT